VRVFCCILLDKIRHALPQERTDQVVGEPSLLGIPIVSYHRHHIAGILVSEGGIDSVAVEAEIVADGTDFGRITVFLHLLRLPIHNEYACHRFQILIVRLGIHIIVRDPAVDVTSGDSIFRVDIDCIHGTALKIGGSVVTCL